MPTIPSVCTAVRSATVVDQPADKAMIVEKGSANAGLVASSSFDTRAIDWTGVWDNRANPSVDIIFNAPTYNTVTSQKGNCDGGAPWDWPRSCQAFPRFRHSETANVTFFDSHAKGMKKGQLNYGRNVRIDGITI